MTNMGNNAKSLKNKKLRYNEYYDTQDMFDNLYEKSKQGHKFKNLMELIMDEKNIQLAYRRIKRNKGRNTPGVDGKTINDIAGLAPDKYIDYIQKQLKNYHPKPVKRVYIPKKNGGERPLGIPTVTDRLVQQCILQVLEPICEAKFYEHSYGFRPNRSTHHAISRVVSLINIQKQYYCVDIDIKGFFDNVNHDKLMRQLWHLGIQDKSLLNVINKILKAEIKDVGKPDKGTPQGGVLSPLLSNIVLNELDWWISSQWQGMKTKHSYSGTREKFRALRNSNLKEMYIVRYADDFKVFCKTYEQAQKAKIAITKWIEERLGLQINEEKSSVTNLKKKKTDFLGFSIGVIKKNTTRGTHVAITNMSISSREHATEKIKDAIKQISKHPDRENVLYYNALVRGLHQYYQIATHVSGDFGKIHNKLHKAYYHAFLNPKRGVAKRGIGPLYKTTFLNTYGKYIKYPYLCNVYSITLIPISGIIHKYPVNFSQDVTPYTEEGRAKIHTALSKELLIVAQALMDNYDKENIELNDNRVSVYLKQQGKCFVTNEILTLEIMELHHKKPKKAGGTDEVSNLVYITYDIHKLVHATEEFIIKRYLNSVKLTDGQLNKLNQLRKLVNNEIIHSADE